MARGEDVTQGDGGRGFSAPEAPFLSLETSLFVVVCCVVFGWMTVMEMRWAKKVSNSDCLISSDVYGYLYFDLVRYMKCTFSLSLAFGRFLYGLFLYIK